MVIVAGPSCSGKSTLGQIAKAKGALIVESTDVVKEAFRTSSVPGEDIIDFCVRTYREQGEEVFAEQNRARFLSACFDLSRLVCIGCRAAGEIEYLRRTMPVSRVIGVYADTTMRYQRGVIRGRADHAKTLDAFIRRDMREYAMGLAALLSTTTDVLLINNGSMAEFEQGVQAELSRAHE